MNWKKQRKQLSRGFSLVEVIVAILILVVLAIGGAALLSHTGIGVLTQGNMRIAMELANLRHEVVRTQDYYDISGDFGADNSVFLSDTDNDGILELNDSAITETLDIAGLSYRMGTEVIRWRHDDPDNPAPYLQPEHLEVIVRVQYRQGSEDIIELRQVRIPPEITLN